MNFLNDKKTLILIITVGVSYKLILVWSGLTEGSLIADDAYYYFTIARNIAHGFGPTFDRLAPTNGFHPLWLMAIVPIFKFFRESLWLPIHMALSLSVILDLASGLLIYKILDNNKMRPAALIAVAIWFLSPFTLLIGLRGMEASLSVLLTLLLLRQLIMATNKADSLSIKSSIIEGLLLGMAGLARTDNLPILGLVLAVFMIMTRAKASYAKAFLWFLRTVIVATVLMLPWFLWNYEKFGSIMQASGQVKFYLIAKSGSFFTGWNSLVGAIRSLAYTVLAPVVFPSKFLSGEEFKSPLISVAVILGFMAIMLIPLFYGRKSMRGRLTDDPIRSVMVFSLIYILTHIIVYGFLLRFYNVWYALPFYAFFAILFGISIPKFLISINLRALKIFAIALLIIFAISTHLLFLFRNSCQARWPEIYYGQTLSAIAEKYPQGAIIGAFNAGALGYIAPNYGNLRVVNLDCLVNNVAFDAVKNGDYYNYVTRTVDVFCEDPMAVSMFVSKSECDSLCSIYKRSNGQAYWAKIK